MIKQFKYFHRFETKGKEHNQITVTALNQGLLDLDGRNSQKYLHQTWADF